MTREGPSWPWWLALAIVLVTPLLMGGCQTTRDYDCRTWRQADGVEYNRAKRDACFPDCDSCGPVLRERNPYDQ
jgi:hypothetical protein